MAIQPDREPPAFDFREVMLSYDPQIVADRIVWPLVNELVGYDWRKESRLGDDVKLPRHGVDEEGITTSVYLSVQKMADLESPREDEGVSTVNLQIEDIQEGEARKHFIAAIRAANPDEEDILTRMDNSALVARAAVVYTFDTAGGCGIDNFQRLDTRDRSVSWGEVNYPEHDEEEIEEASVAKEVGGRYEEAVRLLAQDLHFIRRALYVFKISSGLRTELDHLIESGGN